MKRNIYLDSTLLHAAEVGPESFTRVARALGLDATNLALRMSWLKEQPEEYRIKVAKAKERIGVRDDQRDPARPETASAETPEELPSQA